MLSPTTVPTPFCVFASSHLRQRYSAESSTAPVLRLFIGNRPAPLPTSITDDDLLMNTPPVHSTSYPPSSFHLSMHLLPLMPWAPTPPTVALVVEQPTFHLAVPSL